MKEYRFDVVIAGAGPAGAVAAKCLAQAGLRVLLVHWRMSPAWRPPELLAPSARPLLCRLGLHQVLECSGAVARPAFGIRSSWAGCEHIDDFMGHRDGEGHFVERVGFDEILRNCASACGTEVASGSVVGCARESGGRWTVEISQAAAVTADVLVDATGRSASVARRVGAARVTSDRLVARPIVSTSSTLRRWLRVETSQEGWSYETDAGAVLISDSQGSSARRGPALDASSAALDTPVGSGWIAVGDAACSFDPLSGQGLVQAISSGEAGAMAIQAHLQGQHGALEAYARAVRATWLRTEALRHAVYASETRWSEAPFWRRRAECAASFESTKHRLQRA